MTERQLKFIDDEGNEKSDSLFLNRPIDDFTRLLQSSDYTVYSLTGDWGSGKTTFIRLWEKTSKPEEYIHIDAFEMDYEIEPFIMLIRHLNDYLKKQENVNKELLANFITKAKNIFTRSIKTLPKIAINIMASKLTSNENAEKLITDFGEILFDELVTKESEEASLYSKLKSALEEITSKMEKSLYIIVDELDRCRPSFALETLEKIKHIFTVKNHCCPV